MKKSNRFAAYYFVGKRAVAVELHHSESEFEVTSVVERESPEELSKLLSSPSISNPQGIHLLVDEIEVIKKAGSLSAPNISFCLDSQLAFTHTFPIDETLSEAEAAEQVRWELSSYVHPLTYDNYVTATARLDSLRHPSVSLMLSASARRDLVFLLRHAASTLGLSLAVIDVDHFGAEHALKWNYPEIEQETAILLGLKSELIHLTLFRKGVPVRYRTVETLNGKTMRSVLDEFLFHDADGGSTRRKVYVYGEHKELPGLTVHGNENGPTIELLDPLRHLKIPRTLRKMDRKAFHHLAPVIGIAMRSG